MMMLFVSWFSVVVDAAAAAAVASNVDNNNVFFACVLFLSIGVHGRLQSKEPDIVRANSLSLSQ